MIPVENKEEIITNTTGVSISFKIDESSYHIYDLLRSKLYENGKESLVRELMCNARDSHIAAQKSDVPIKVWMPGNFLIIEDEGEGLSKERVSEVFAYYGRSTKRESNAQSGMFGIGAKSFFSYATSASITSWYDGIKYEYAAFIGENGVGEIKLLTEAPSDRCNGVAIKIPIKSQDKHEFCRYIRKYTSFWSLPPQLIGDNVFQQIEKPKVVMSGTNWVMYENEEMNRFNVLLDGIPYNYSIYGLPPKVTFLFSIGQLIPSATRESLSVCESNEKVIRAAAEVFKAEIKTIIEDRLATCDNFIEVINHIHSSKKFFSIESSKWKWAKGEIEYPFSDYIFSYRKANGYPDKRRVNQFGELKDKAILLVDEDFDYAEVKGYVTRKINFHKEKHALREIYLVKPSHGIPNDVVTDFNTIKISYATGPTGPRVKKPKTQIFGRKYGTKTRDRWDIDGQKNVLIYTTDMKALRETYSGFSNLRYYFTLVEIAENDVKWIKGKENWSTLKEYLDKELLTDYNNREALEIEYAKYKTGQTYKNFQFLKGHLTTELNVALEKSKLTDRQSELVEFLIENSEATSLKIPDIFHQYPLLKMVTDYNVAGAGNYYNSNEKAATKENLIEYVTLINQKQKEQISNV